MTRQIKFRAWDRVKEKMITDQSEIFYYLGLPKEAQRLQPQRDFMQFTGLLDKNGREIYEKDRIKTPAGIGVVEYQGGCWIVQWNEKEWTTLHDTPMGMLEVIGNIYES